VSQLFGQLCKLDQQLFSFLAEDELNVEEILILVDKREQLLQNIVNEQPRASGTGDHRLEWQDAIARTKQLVTLMQGNGQRLGQQLTKIRHGNKSVQRYQQFL
jgi:flagellar rod protein FlaI